MKINKDKKTLIVTTQDPLQVAMQEFLDDNDINLWEQAIVRAIYGKERDYLKIIKALYPKENFEVIWIQKMDKPFNYELLKDEKVLNPSKPTWNEYFMSHAHVAKLRSPDPKTKVGAVLVGPDHRLISTGYNGLVKGADENIDWSNREYVYKRIIHAEANCLVAAESKFKHATLYTTLSPCSECLKLLAASGVVDVVYDKPYKDIEEVIELSKELGICLMPMTLFTKNRNIHELLKEYEDLLRL